MELCYLVKAVYVCQTNTQYLTFVNFLSFLFYFLLLILRILCIVKHYPSFQLQKIIFLRMYWDSTWTVRIIFSAQLIYERVYWSWKALELSLFSVCKTDTDFGFLKIFKLQLFTLPLLVFNECYLFQNIWIVSVFLNDGFLITSTLVIKSCENGKQWLHGFVGSNPTAAMDIQNGLKAGSDWQTQPK